MLSITNTDLGLLVAGSIIIPWLIYITKALQSITQDTQWIKKVHEPDANGMMVWKNPGMLQALHENNDLLREILSLLEKHHNSTEKAVDQVAAIMERMNR